MIYDDGRIGGTARVDRRAVHDQWWHAGTTHHDRPIGDQRIEVFLRGGDHTDGIVVRSNGTTRSLIEEQEPVTEDGLPTRILERARAVDLMEIEIGRNAVDGIRGGAIGQYWNHPWRDQV